MDSNQSTAPPHRIFRKRPVFVAAFRYRLDLAPNWFQEAVVHGDVEIHATSCTIKTLEGDMRCESGDWVIWGVKGEMYPCKPDIFAMTYEEMDNQP